MLVNLTDVLTTEDKVVNQRVALEMERFECRLGSFEFGEKEPVELVLTNLGKNRLLIEGKCRLTVIIPCDRCLSDVEIPFELSVSREVDMTGGQEQGPDEPDEADYLIDCHLDVDKLIHSEILLCWPMKVLCREDCRGICESCGRNLNEGECGCERQKLDPRMAVIKDIFKQQ